VPFDDIPLRESALGNDVEFLAIKLFSAGTQRANDALFPLDLRVRLYSVLALASSGARPSQRDLAEFLFLDPSQIVALVSELEKRALVAREVDPADRRSKVIVATPSGMEVFQKALAATKAAQEVTLAPLSEDERDTLRALLRKVVFGARNDNQGNVTE
jgi:DNA-binding MarR family transcriptional regulator